MTKSFNRLKNGDLVQKINFEECGIVVSAQPSNNYPSKHIENVFESWPCHYYVLFKNGVEGPFLGGELLKVI